MSRFFRWFAKDLLFAVITFGMAAAVTAAWVAVIRFIVNG